MHCGLKDSFRYRSNFRDVEEQVSRFSYVIITVMTCDFKLLRADHWFHVTNFIQAKIDLLDVQTRKAQEEDEERSPETDKITPAKSPTSPIDCGNIYLGAGRKSVAIRLVMAQHSQEPIFKNFYSELVSFLSSELGQAFAQNVELSTEVSFSMHYNVLNFTSFQVFEYRFLKATFESKVTCRAEVDYLRCSPCYHDQPRYDTVLINMNSKPAFAQLRFVFNVLLKGVSYLIAFVQPFKRVMGRTLNHDKELGFLRLHKQHAHFIWARSIIRGVPVFPAFDIEDDFIVFDVIDPDMALRVQEILNTS